MNDKKKVLALVSLTVGLLLLSVPTLAHHGTGISYDESQVQTAEGVVTAYRHANPHPQIFVDITAENGDVTAWVFEVAPTPFTMSQNGWGRRRALEALKEGTEVTVTFYPSRAGTPIGVVRGLNSENEPNVLGLARGARGGRGR